MRCSARRLPWRLSRVVILRPEPVTAIQQGHAAGIVALYVQQTYAVTYPCALIM